MDTNSKKSSNCLFLSIYVDYTNNWQWWFTYSNIESNNSYIHAIQHCSTSYTSTTYFEEMKQLYYLDEFRTEVQAWNKERSGALEMALQSILYPQLAKELKTKLVAEAKEGIIKVSIG